MKIFQKAFRFVILNGAAIIGKYNFNYYKRISKKADKKSEKLLLKLIRKNSNTEFGKKYKFKDIKTIKDYQEKMPYTNYDDYREYVRRMTVEGKKDLLTNNKICCVCITSGTTGMMKEIPISRKSLKPFLKSGTIFAWQLREEMKKKKKGALNGKILNLSEPVSGTTPSGIKRGGVSSYFTSSLKIFLPISTCMPKEVLGHEKDIDMKYIKARYALQEADIICIDSVFMSSITDLMTYIEDNHEMLIKDIEEGQINSNIKIPADIRKRLERKLKPDLKRSKELKKIFVEETKKGLATKLWKRLSLIISICTGEFTPFQEKMREYCDNDVTFSYSMYAASEATIASSQYVENEDYLLLCDGGFYEFIPLDNEEEVKLMNELEIGKLYEVVVTNFSGLYRYKIKDVVKVTGYQGKIPLIQFSHRKGQLLNLGSSHITMEHLVEIIKRFEQELKVHITDYSIYVDTDHSPARLVLFIETDRETMQSGEEMTKNFDKILIETVKALEIIMIEHADIAQSVIYTVKKGTYEKYREMKLKKDIPVNQIKTVRLIKDKETLQYFLDSRKVIVENDRLDTIN